jgi:predicted Zn-dependent peptidase
MSAPLANLNLNQSTEDSKTRLTKLSNGLRVMTDSNNYGSCRIGFMSDVGTVDEDPSWSAGINNMLNVL